MTIPGGVQKKQRFFGPFSRSIFKSALFLGVCCAAFQSAALDASVGRESVGLSFVFGQKQISLLSSGEVENKVKLSEPFSKWVDEALMKVTLEERSQVDLLVFKTDDGREVLVPRFVFQRHPIGLSLMNGANGPKASLVFSGGLRDRLAAEGLPASSYEVQGIKTVEFETFKHRFVSFYLSRRSDPTAVRGEKLFLQKCVSCHQNQGVNQMTTGNASAKVPAKVIEKAPERLLETLKKSHPGLGTLSQLSDSEMRALTNYRDQLREENKAKKPLTGPF